HAVAGRAGARPARSRRRPQRQAGDRGSRRVQEPDAARVSEPTNEPSESWAQLDRDVFMDTTAEDSDVALADATGRREPIPREEKIRWVIMAVLTAIWAGCIGAAVGIQVAFGEVATAAAATLTAAASVPAGLFGYAVAYYFVRR